MEIPTPTGFFPGRAFEIALSAWTDDKTPYIKLPLTGSKWTEVRVIPEANGTDLYSLEFRKDGDLETAEAVFGLTREAARRVFEKESGLLLTDAEQVTPTMPSEWLKEAIQSIDDKYPAYLIPLGNSPLYEAVMIERDGNGTYSMLPLRTTAEGEKLSGPEIRHALPKDLEAVFSKVTGVHLLDAEERERIVD